MHKNRYLLGAMALLASVLACLAVTRASPANESVRLPEVLGELSKSPTGVSLIARAEKAWGLSSGSAEIVNFLKWGETSKTDAVLTRFFNPKTGEEHRERRVAIFLKRNQSAENLILDLAHELVHASSRPVWDPYDPALTPARYIQSAIDGEGGEVDAVIAECRVGLELNLDLGSSTARCQSYFEKGDPRARVQRDKVASDFYRSGIWAETLRKRLGPDSDALLPKLSPEPPVLYSSTGKLPYPMALFEEFQVLTEIACRNTANRLASGSVPVRSLASRFVNSRCQGQSEKPASPSGLSARRSASE